MRPVTAYIRVLHLWAQSDAVHDSGRAYLRDSLRKGLTTRS